MSFICSALVITEPVSFICSTLPYTVSDCNDNDDSSRVEELDMDGTPKDTQKKKVPTFLALPATAASSEGAFSIAGLIICAKRVSLDPSTVTDLNFLRENSHHKIDSLASS